MYTTERMRRFATYCLTLVAILLVVVSNTECAASWKLILKNGSVIECDGAPMIVDDVYMFRQKDGENGNLPAGQIDVEKTDRVNQVDRREWRAVGVSREQDSAVVVGNSRSDIMTLRDADFDARVLQSQKPVMVEFWATWCRPCRQFEPTVNAIASEYAGRLRVGKVDIDQSPATAKRYSINGTPTVVLFKQGQRVGSIVGVADKTEVARMVRSGL
jgi:thioredoxin 1